MADNHALYLGKLVGNLQSLETVLRAYLLKMEQRQMPASPIGPAYWQLAVDDVVRADAFTNYDSLGSLIDKFNADIQARDEALQIDSAVVSIRDLLAHGRIAADNPDPAQLKIVKFDKPNNAGSVRVVACALMDEAWFLTQINLVVLQIRRVSEACNRFAV